MLDIDGRSDVVVFYSGHGVPGLSDQGAYVLPVEAGPDTAEISGYPLGLLYDNLGKLADARSVQVFLDACFSGNSHAGMLIRRASPVSMSFELSDDLPRKLTILAAASSDQIASWDEEARHGLFTHHVLDALYGMADADGDGQVTSSEAKAYLDREMTGAARRLRRRQSANLIEGAEAAILSEKPAAGFPARLPVHLMTAAGIPVEDLSPAATRLSRLLGRPFSAEVRDEVGWTDLHYAAVLDMPELIATLIDAGVPVDVRLEEGSPPFGERLQEVLRTLGHEQFSGGTAAGETPLMIAAAVNSDATTRELIARGADIALPNTSAGNMPLHYAAIHNAVDVIAALIAHGADVNARIGGDGWMPLHVAAHWNAGDAVTELLTRGADMEAPSSTRENEFDNLIYPLARAAATNALKSIRALIAAGANVNVGALAIATSRNHRETVALLIESGAQVDIAHDVWGGITALHWTGDPQIISLLVDKTANVNAKDKDGKTPLHVGAEELWNFDVLSLESLTALINHGADVNAKDNGGHTPLHLAAQALTVYTGEIFDNEQTSPEAVLVLLAHGADVNAKNNKGETALHLAAKRGSYKILAALIGGGADIRAKTSAGNTILDLWATKPAYMWRPEE